MKFWEWLIELSSRPRKDRQTAGIVEYVIGIAIGIGASIGVATIISPIWLALTIPAGVFMALHGYWNAWVR